MSEANAGKALFAPRKKPKSTVDTVVETIKSLLKDRKLRPGDLLPSENEIAESLSISRGSIREAMKILAAFGVIEIRRGDGTYVATSANKKIFDPLLFHLLVTQPELEELAEMRLLVELGVVHLAAAHAGGPDLDELEAAYRDMAAQCGSGGKGLYDAERRYHEVLGRITHNRLVENLYHFVIDLLAPTMRPGHGMETHKKIVDALRARDTDAADAAIREHDEIWKKLNLDDAARPRP